MHIFAFIILFLSGTHLYALPNMDDVIAKTDACIQARQKGQEGSITDYSCPSGESFAGDGQPITPERLCADIYIQLAFLEIDKEAEKYIKELSETRNTNPTSWIASIAKKRDEWRMKYRSACAIPNYTIGAKRCAITTDFFPMTTCESLADAKALGWARAGYIMASRGIAKGYQNEKDTYMTKTKNKYETLLNNWRRYTTTLSNAVSKFTAYIRNAVKG